MAAGTITADLNSLDNQISGLRIRRNEIREFEGWRQGMHSTSETSDGLWKKVYVHQDSFYVVLYILTCNDFFNIKK